MSRFCLEEMSRKSYKKHSSRFFYFGFTSSSGLICAYQFREVFPALQNDVYIASSIYFISRQVKSNSFFFIMIIVALVSDDLFS